MEFVEHYVTLVIEYDDGSIKYHTLNPFIASIRMLELPFEEVIPRPVKAKIIWGNVLDNLNY